MTDGTEGGSPPEARAAGGRRSDATENEAQGEREVALRLSRISKTFPGTQALDDVSIDIVRGQTHALVGGNGSGKSTLVKILAGVYRADPGGTITLAGHDAIPADHVTPELAHRSGLRFVHQSLAVFPDLSVAENLSLPAAFRRSAYGRIRWRATRAWAASVLERLEIDAEPATPLGDLRPAHQTMVAVARALRDEEAGDGAAVLVLDEPTAALPQDDVDTLLSALRAYGAAGSTIIYVSHRLDEVLSIADSVSVLRDGRHVVTRPASGLSEAKMIEYIVGRPLDRLYPPQHDAPKQDLACEVRGVTAGPLRGVSFAGAKGEIIGVAGVLGSGCEEIVRLLFGAMRLESGSVLINGVPARLDSPADAVELGIAYVPGNRSEAAFADLSVRENLSAARVDAYARLGRVNGRREAREAHALIQRFKIRTASDRASISTLSGGNQQKVILARWLARSPNLLLLDDPTQGVDVGSRAEIYGMMEAAASRGTCIILVSSDLEEIAHLSHRVIILRRGRVDAELWPPELTSDALANLVYAAAER